MPRHPRGGTGRLPWVPPRPPTSAVHTRQLSLFSMCYVHVHLALTVLVTGLLMPACNSYVARLCPRHNAVEHFVNTVEAFPDIRHSATTLQAQEPWRTGTGRRNSARLGNMVRCQTPYAHWCCLCLWTTTTLGRHPVKTELSIHVIEVVTLGSLHGADQRTGALLHLTHP